MPEFTNFEGFLVHVQEARDAVFEARRELPVEKYKALMEHLNGAINVYLNNV